MVHNILKNTQIEKNKCVAVWGSDMLATVTTMLEYFKLLDLKILLIPTEPLQLHLNLELKIVNLDRCLSDANICELTGESCMLVKIKKDKRVTALELKEFSVIPEQFFSGFDVVIYISNFDRPDLLFNEAKDEIKKSVFPQQGYIFINANLLGSNIIKAQSLLSPLNDTEKNDPIIRTVWFLKEQKEMPVNIIFVEVDSCFKENEITAISKELVNTGIYKIYYFLDNQCHFIGSR